MRSACSAASGSPASSSICAAPAVSIARFRSKPERVKGRGAFRVETAALLDRPAACHEGREAGADRRTARKRRPRFLQQLRESRGRGRNGNRALGERLGEEAREPSDEVRPGVPAVGVLERLFECLRTLEPAAVHVGAVALQPPRLGQAELVPELLELRDQLEREPHALVGESGAAERAQELPLDHRLQLRRAVAELPGHLERLVEIGLGAGHLAGGDARRPQLRQKHRPRGLVTWKQCERPFEERDRGGHVGLAERDVSGRAQQAAGAGAERFVGGAELPPEQKGLLEVVAGQGVLGAEPFEPRREALVEMSASGLGDAVVGGVPDQRVMEPETFLRGRRVRPDEPLRARARRCAWTRPPSSSGVRSRTASSVKLRPATAARSSTPRSSRASRSIRSWRTPRIDPGMAPTPPSLVLAASCSAKSGFPSAAPAICARARRSGPRALRAASPIRPSTAAPGRVPWPVPGARPAAARPLRPREAEQQDTCLPEPAREVLDEVEEGRLGPVDVVEGDDQRALGGKLLEHAARGGKDLVAAPLQRFLAAPGLAEQLAQRPERDPLSVGRAAADEHRRFRRDAGEELPGEPRLADPRLPEERRLPGAAAARGLCEEPAEPGELGPRPTNAVSSRRGRRSPPRR